MSSSANREYPEVCGNCGGDNWRPVDEATAAGSLVLAILGEGAEACGDCDEQGSLVVP